MTQDQRPSHVDAPNLSDAALEDLFAEARSAAPEALVKGLDARLMADAAKMLPLRAAPRPQAGIWTRFQSLLSELGGLPGVASLGAAGLAGLWVGFAEPGGTGTLLTQFWQGAAQISPGLSALVVPVEGDGEGGGETDELIALLSGELE